MASKKSPQKRQLAVALRYEPKKDRAPRIAAKGQGPLAERILELAKIHGVPIREDGDLVQLLSKLELESEIPPDLYKVIAEVLIFIYSTNQKAKKKISPPPGGATPN